MSETKPFAVGRGNHAAVNNLRVYYEIHGAGQPLVVLHGGPGGIEMLGSNLEALAKTAKSSLWITRRTGTRRLSTPSRLYPGG